MSELKPKNQKLQINFFNADFLKYSKQKIFPKPPPPHSHIPSNPKNPSPSTSLYSLEKETKNTTTLDDSKDKDKLILKLNHRITELESRIKRLESSFPSSHLKRSTSSKNKNNTLTKQTKSSFTTIVHAKRTFSNMKVVKRDNSYSNYNSNVLSRKGSGVLSRNEEHREGSVGGMERKSKMNRSVDIGGIIPKIPKGNKGDGLKGRLDLIKERTRNLLECVFSGKEGIGKKSKEDMIKRTCKEKWLSGSVTPKMKKERYSRNKSFY